jgi:hypothetical protein
LGISDDAHAGIGHFSGHLTGRLRSSWTSTRAAPIRIVGRAGWTSRLNRFLSMPR